jgi:hypothetical protein
VGSDVSHANSDARPALSVTQKTWSEPSAPKTAFGKPNATSRGTATLCAGRINKIDVGPTLPTKVSFLKKSATIATVSPYEAIDGQRIVRVGRLPG